MKPCHFLRLLAALVLSLFSHSSFAAYACNVSATSLGLLYASAANTDDTGTVTLNCTRALTDANTLTYRLYINNGANPSGTAPNQQRRGLHTTIAATYINYSVFRDAARTLAWRWPTTGTTNVVTGTLNFGAGTTASFTGTYYLRVPSGQTTAPAGIYTDTLQAAGRYPNNNAGTLTTSAPISLTIGVGNQCVFRSQPGGINLNYTSFSASPVSATTSVAIRCTNLLPYSVAISPTSASVVGLTYNMSVDTTNVTGTGLDQTRTITATIPAGQDGTCATATCTASQTHTVVVTY